MTKKNFTSEGASWNFRSHAEPLNLNPSYWNLTGVFFRSNLTHRKKVGGIFQLLWEMMHPNPYVIIGTSILYIILRSGGRQWIKTQELELRSSVSDRPLTTTGIGLFQLGLFFGVFELICIKAALMWLFTFVLFSQTTEFFSRTTIASLSSFLAET